MVSGCHIDGTDLELRILIFIFLIAIAMYIVFSVLIGQDQYVCYIYLKYAARL